MTDETNNKKKKFMLKSDNDSKNTSMFRPILVSCSITYTSFLFSGVQPNFQICEGNC